MAANPLSDYANNLAPHVKKRCYEKISCVAIDPILIPDKAYDPDCLPRVESMDFWLSFLVLETSSYGKDQAYNQLISGFVSCVKGPKKGKQLHCSRKSEAFTENERSVCYIVDYNRGKW